MSRKEIDAALYGSRKSKYGVDTSEAGREARTIDGITFHSKHERDVYIDYIKPQVGIGIFSNLRFQVPFALHAISPGGMVVKVGTYIADFVVTDREGKPHILEAKGYLTKEYRLKKKIFEVQYGLRITEL